MGTSSNAKPSLVVDGPLRLDKEKNKKRGSSGRCPAKSATSSRGPSRRCSHDTTRKQGQSHHGSDGMACRGSRAPVPTWTFAPDATVRARSNTTDANPGPPPQTTHYWTSDRTRRLEYAAIDAATRGMRGWVMRRLVPDCLVSRDKRPTRLDDDTGSVRRYRLPLNEEEDEEDMDQKNRLRKAKTWWR